MITELNKTGRYHIKNKTENQDVVCHGENNRFTVISLADGTSSCREAKTGAEISCKAVTNMLLNKGEFLFEYDLKKISDLLLANILYKLKKKAAEDSENINEYSSTLASVLIDKVNKKILCFNLGDGIILSTEKGRCHVLSPPADNSGGCCVTTTAWAEDMASVNCMNLAETGSILICSDGTWNNMYERGKLRPEVKLLICNNDFDGLKEYLLKQECVDDYSFISASIN